MLEVKWRSAFIIIILQTSRKINVKSHHQWAALLFFFVFTYTLSGVVWVSMRVVLVVQLLFFSKLSVLVVFVFPGHEHDRFCVRVGRD